MFSKFFINRPNFAIVLSLILIIAGIMAIRSLPVQEYPDVVPPQIIVSTSYPGADAKTLENSVASILEEKINGVENMLYMMSTTSPSGLLTMNLYFEVDTDMAQAPAKTLKSTHAAEIGKKGHPAVILLIEESEGLLKKRIIAAGKKQLVIIG